MINVGDKLLCIISYYPYYGNYITDVFVKGSEYEVAKKFDDRVLLFIKGNGSFSVKNKSICNHFLTPSEVRKEKLENLSISYPSI